MNIVRHEIELGFSANYTLNGKYCKATYPIDVWLHANNIKALHVPCKRSV